MSGNYDPTQEAEGIVNEEKKDVAPVEQKQPTNPGIGMSGLVMCPYGLQKSPCLREGCEMWVELNYGDKVVGRCANAWNAVLFVELRQSVDKIVDAIGSEEEQN